MEKIEVDPMDRMNQCQAKSKRSGQRCKRYASKGMKVCRMHGGVLGSEKSQKRKRQAALRHGLCTHESIKQKKLMKQFIKNCKESISSI